MVTDLAIIALALGALFVAYKAVVGLVKFIVMGLIALGTVYLLSSGVW